MRCWRAARRRGGYGAALAAVALTIASCAGHAAPALVAAPGPTPEAGAAALRITQVMVGHNLFVEGSFSYIRIEPTAGGVPIQRRLPGSGKLTIKLDPGAYRLVSWQRACDGNCGYLDPPSDRCARTFTIRQHHPLQAAIRLNPAAGCTIVIRG